MENLFLLTMEKFYSTDNSYCYSPSGRLFVPKEKKPERGYTWEQIMESVRKYGIYRPYVPLQMHWIGHIV